MTLIVRPVKPVGNGGGGSAWVDGKQVPAAELNGDVDTIYADHNGSITDANCSAAMALQGTKLADAPAGVPSTKINTDAVLAAKIKIRNFDWNNPAALATHNVNSISTGLSSDDIVPIIAHLFRAGVPSTEAALNVHVFLNTVTKLYHLEISNDGLATIDLPALGVGVRFLYISKA